MTVFYKTVAAERPYAKPMRFQVALLTAFFSLCAIALAETPAASLSPEMAAVQWLNGHWEGGGWTYGPQGERREFEGTETVESRLGGELLIIEGRHVLKQNPNHLIHHAVAYVAYDSTRAEFKFQPFAAGRPPAVAIATLADGAFVWSMQTPAGTIRYTIRQTPSGAWKEIGERLAGERWVQFFDMTMKRVR